MCNYCGCDQNNPVTGMRSGPWAGDPADHQGDQNYSWTGNIVTMNPDNPEPVPPVGLQYQQSQGPRNMPIKLGTDK
jgi:hypothetical protein